MKEKIEEKTKKLQQIIDAINNSRQQIAKWEQEGLMLQGELRVLNELEQEKVKETKKPTKKPTK